ncbi:MAG: hypothetical protein EOO51_12265 [Flavobacterium sp.]|nr:MAG: hypothetical protein EOO51_12265 [Flavobacterium sp.]
MPTNITTLAINLLISGRIGHRKELAEKMIAYLEQFKDASEIERHLKSSFHGVIAKCVEDPNCKSRDDFFRLAQFYDQKVKGNSSTTIAA